MNTRRKHNKKSCIDSEYYILPLGELGYRENHTFDLCVLQRAEPLREIKQKFYESMIVAFTFDDGGMYAPHNLSEIEVEETQNFNVWIEDNQLHLKHHPNKGTCKGIFMHYGTCGGLNLCLSAFLLKKGSRINFVV